MDKIRSEDIAAGSITANPVPVVRDNPLFRRAYGLDARDTSETEARLRATLDETRVALRRASRLLPRERPEEGGDPKWLAKDKAFIRAALERADHVVDRHGSEDPLVLAEIEAVAQAIRVPTATYPMMFSRREIEAAKRAIAALDAERVRKSKDA